MTKFDDCNTQVLGLSVDSMFALRTWAMSMGGIRHPLLADFWPHGDASRSLGIFNEESGISNRALFIFGPDGTVRHSELHQGTLPDPQDVLSHLARLQA